MWLEVVETGGQLFDSPAPLKAVGAAFCPKSPGFTQSQHLLSQAGNKSCLSYITSGTKCPGHLCIPILPERAYTVGKLVPTQTYEPMSPAESPEERSFCKIALLRVTVRLTVPLAQGQEASL